MIFTNNSQIVAYGDHLLLRRQEMRDDDYDESGQNELEVGSLVDLHGVWTQLNTAVGYFSTK